MKETNSNPLNAMCSIMLLTLAILLLIHSCELNNDKDKNCGLYNGIKQCN